MKILHLADLHFGKKLYEASLAENGDQQYWVNGILKHIEETKPDAVVIAGDVYDKGDPAKEAIPLLSDLLTGISEQGIPTFLTAGNHDGGERLEFLSELLKKQNIFIAGTVKKEMAHFTRDFGDGYGPVTFWLMPYTFPAAVRVALELEDGTPLSYTDAVRMMLGIQPIDPSQRNVLVAHQTVIGAGDRVKENYSEEYVGGAGSVDPSVFEPFDYVALGHLHGQHKAGADRIWYAGSPLCYHFSEAGQRKGALEVTLNEKGSLPEVVCTEIPPLHRVRKTMTGTLEEIVAAEKDSTVRNEYVNVEITDERIDVNAKETLSELFRSHGCELLNLTRRPRSWGNAGTNRAAAKELTLEEEFTEFYRKRSFERDPEPDEAELIRFAAERISSGAELNADELSNEIVRLALEQEDRK